VSQLPGLISSTYTSIALINPNTGNILQTFYQFPGFQYSGIPGCTFINYPIYATYLQDVSSGNLYLLQYNLKENKTVKFDFLNITCCVYSSNQNKVYAIQQNYTGSYFFGELNMDTYKFDSIALLPGPVSMQPVSAYDPVNELYWFYVQADQNGNQVLFALDSTGNRRYHFANVIFQQPNLAVYVPS